MGKQSSTETQSFIGMIGKQYIHVITIGKQRMNTNTITYRHEKKAVYTRLAIIYTQQRKALDTHKTISYRHDTI